MPLTKGQIESFSLIVYKALSNKRTGYVQRVLQGFNDFNDDKCFYKWNSLLSIIWLYNPGNVSEIASGETLANFIMPNENNIVEVEIAKLDTWDYSNWLVPKNIISIENAGLFQIVSVDDTTVIIRSLPGYSNTAQGTTITAGSQVNRSSNCVSVEGVTNIMEFLNFELGLNIVLNSLPETNLNG